jgi:hypothetical protein
MKMIASGLLVLGLLAAQISEANAVVCARGSLSRWVRRTTWRGRWAPRIRLPRRRGGAPCLWRALLLARWRARLPLSGQAKIVTAPPTDRCDFASGAH